MSNNELACEDKNKNKFEFNTMITRALTLAGTTSFIYGANMAFGEIPPFYKKESETVTFLPIKISYFNERITIPLGFAYMFRDELSSNAIVKMLGIGDTFLLGDVVGTMIRYFTNAMLFFPRHGSKKESIAWKVSDFSIAAFITLFAELFHYLFDFLIFKDAFPTKCALTI